MNYDVIIVGAGPGGLNCAKTLADSRLKILVLEKKPVIGPKVCAGGLFRKAIDYLDLPYDLLNSRHNTLHIHWGKKARVVKSDKDFIHTIDREILGQWQLSRLKGHNNITVRTDSRFDKADNDHVYVDGIKFGYRFLVGADGSNSRVARHLEKKNLKPKSKKKDMAFHYIVPTRGFKNLEIHNNPRLFSAWYAWVFPHKNSASIGSGGDPNYISGKKVIENFHAWAKEKRINLADATYEAFPINYDYTGHEFGNIFLIGDAGGFASGLTGEGIYQALISGQEAARKILDRHYASAIIPRLLKTKQKHDRILRFRLTHPHMAALFDKVQPYLLQSTYFKSRMFKEMF